MRSILEVLEIWLIPENLKYFAVFCSILSIGNTDKVKYAKGRYEAVKL